ncbi:MAG: protein-export chaperone SecB [Gammaproteobacteria bacterium]|nr:protein-export chaperone SecB [Gammaproteobacteria bacterium]
MTDTQGNTGNGAQREFTIQKIYTKDMSFEAPNTPMVFREQWQPQVNMQLGNQAQSLGEGVHEIVLSVTVTAKIGDKTAYLCEVQQAGIFTIKNYNDQEMGAMVGAFCPNILFPYVRELVSELVTRGGFPQLLLAPVNFDALYQQHLQQLQSAKPETAH